MAHLRMGLVGYLEETYLHGFKYLGRGSGSVSKLYWTVVICASISYAIHQIHEQVINYIDSPVITTVDGIDTPIREIQFPTITFCHNDYFQPDNWALTEHVFNFFSFNCDGSEIGNCNESQKLREDFQPFFKLMFESISDLVENAKFDNSSWPLTSDRVDSVVLAIMNNLTTLEALENILVNSIGKYATATKFYLDWTPKVENEPLKCNDSNCQMIQLRVNKFFVKVESLALKLDRGKTPFGTLLRLFSDKFGITFDDEETERTKTIQKKKCQNINDMERKIHEIMLKLGASFGFAVSLHDLPNFYKVSTSQFRATELRKHYPMYSYCQKMDEFEGAKFPKCDTSWWSMAQDFIPRMTRNPYEQDPDDFCAGKTQNFTGGNMTSILDIMKFAYHAVSEDDLRRLYKIMEESDLPYKMAPIDDIIDSDYLDTYLRPYVQLEEDAEEGEKGNLSMAFTTKGLCYVFNGESMSKVFTSKDVQTWNQGETHIQNGALRRVTFRLDRHEQYFPDRKAVEGSFFVGINGQRAFFDMTSRSTQIQKGLKTTITVPMMSVYSMGDLLELDPDKRDCLFPDELDQVANMTMFASYSMTGCKFECMVNASLKRCHCMPWNMINMNNADICDSAGNDCFFQTMNNNSVWTSNCSNCLVDCNSIKFSFNEKQQDINDKTQCKSMHSGFRDTWRKLGRSSFTVMPKIIDAIEILTTAIQLDQDVQWKQAIRANQDRIISRCRLWLQKDTSLVEIELDGQTFMKLKQSRRTTFPDILGSIGGILGFLCGFSVIAIAELFHWIVFVLKQMCRQKN